MYMTFEDLGLCLDFGLRLVNTIFELSVKYLSSNIFHEFIYLKTQSKYISTFSNLQEELTIFTLYKVGRLVTLPSLHLNIKSN